MTYVCYYVKLIIKAMILKIRRLSVELERWVGLPKFTISIPTFLYFYRQKFNALFYIVLMHMIIKFLIKFHFFTFY